MEWNNKILWSFLFQRIVSLLSNWVKFSRDFRVCFDKNNIRKLLLFRCLDHLYVNPNASSSSIHGKINANFLVIVFEKSIISLTLKIFEEFSYFRQIYITSPIEIRRTISTVEEAGLLLWKYTDKYKCNDRSTQHTDFSFRLIK